MMPNVSFSGLVLVAAVAFIAPLLLGVAPRLRLPATVLEIVIGIMIGPAVLDWVAVDLPVQVLALVGLAFILFLAGLEIEFNRLRGVLLRLACASFALSFGLALIVSYALKVLGLVETPLFVAIVLSATALSVLLPLLKDTGHISTSFGQIVIAAATITDFAATVLLSILFSREATRVGSQLILIGSLVALGFAVALVLLWAKRSMRLSSVLLRLQDTSAQIRVRGAFLLMLIFVGFAEWAGIEVVLGAFIAGTILKLVDRDQAMTHPEFRHRLEAVGFGVFVPCFFISSGLSFDLRSLFTSPQALALVPLLLAALLIVRGLPALLYWRLIGARRSAAAALLQATSLTFIVVASRIGVELGVLEAGTASALLAAGLLSVVIFPLAALTVLRNEAPAHVPDLASPMPLES